MARIAETEMEDQLGREFDEGMAALLRDAPPSSGADESLFGAPDETLSDSDASAMIGAHEIALNQSAKLYAEKIGLTSEWPAYCVSKASAETVPEGSASLPMSDIREIRHLSTMEWALRIRAERLRPVITLCLANTAATLKAADRK